MFKDLKTIIFILVFLGIFTALSISTGTYKLFSIDITKCCILHTGFLFADIGALYLLDKITETSI